MAITYSNKVYIQVKNLSDVLSVYDTIEVHRAPTIDGTFVLITTIPLNNQDDLYLFDDTGGVDTDFYKYRYLDSLSSDTSTFSGTIQGNGIQQLTNNMQVTITLDANIANTDGQLLGSDVQFYFTTTYDPLYSSIKLVQLKGGKYVTEIPDDTINLAIFEASLMAADLTFDKTKAASSSLYRIARKEWVGCKAAEILLFGISSGGGSGLVSSKRLADFAVTYDNRILDRTLMNLMECQARWEGQLIAGGSAIRKPKFVVRGEKDPDQPAIGRGWDGTPGQVPVGNAKINYSNSRRFSKTYWPRTRWPRVSQRILFGKIKGD